MSYIPLIEINYFPNIKGHCFKNLFIYSKSISPKFDSSFQRCSDEMKRIAPSCIIFFLLLLMFRSLIISMMNSFEEIILFPRIFRSMKLMRQLLSLLNNHVSTVFVENCKYFESKISDERTWRVELFCLNEILTEFLAISSLLLNAFRNS